MSYQYRDKRLYEMPGMEEPLSKYFTTRGSNMEVLDHDQDGYIKALKEYKAHLASLKSFPVYPGAWIEGRVYEEGGIELIYEWKLGNHWVESDRAGYEIREDENRRIVARLIEKESEDDLWHEIYEQFTLTGASLQSFNILKSKYSLKRK